MAHFLEIQKRAKRLSPAKISSDLIKFIRTLEKKMADFNREQLNKDNKDVFGKDIGFYSRATDIISDGRKEFGTPFTLFDEGVFLPSIFAKVLNDGIVLFGARDPKTDEVLDNLLTRDIFGQSDENLQKIINDDIKPFLSKYFNKNLLN